MREKLLRFFKTLDITQVENNITKVNFRMDGGRAKRKIKNSKKRKIKNSKKRRIKNSKKRTRKYYKKQK